MASPRSSYGRAHVAIDDGRRMLELSPEQVFLAYFAYGGTEAPTSIYRYLAGEVDLPGRQSDVLAAALDDELLERGLGHPLVPRWGKDLEGG